MGKMLLSTSITGLVIEEVIRMEEINSTELWLDDITGRPRVYSVASPTSVELSDKEKDIIIACIWLVDHRSTIRETAKNNQFAIATLWRGIHNDCKRLSPELYDCVVRQMKIKRCITKNLKMRGNSMTEENVVNVFYTVLLGLVCPFALLIDPVLSLHKDVEE